MENQFDKMMEYFEENVFKKEDRFVANYEQYQYGSN